MGLGPFAEQVQMTKHDKTNRHRKSNMAPSGGKLQQTLRLVHFCCKHVTSKRTDGILMAIGAFLPTMNHHIMELVLVHDGFGL